MTLNFTPIPNNEGSFSAEFTATEDFNLYIEYNTTATAYTQLFVRNSDDQQYAPAFSQRGNVLNEDFHRLVYPVQIKVVAFTQPTKAAYTYSE